MSWVHAVNSSPGSISTGDRVFSSHPSTICILAGEAFGRQLGWRQELPANDGYVFPDMWSAGGERGKGHKERRNITTVNIPGAFMQTNMEDTVHMVLEGTMAELLVKLDPKLYQKYIQVKKGKPVIYVQPRKALYGTLQASLLLWKDLFANLRKWGFEVNPYDWCVANKTINGKQCTMLWHVDDIKISHEDPEVVSQMIELIEGTYGKEAPLTITRGKIHEYLGMTIDYTVPSSR
jgi:hypothetical protein